jgi:hypothetical protein
MIYIYKHIYISRAVREVAAGSVVVSVPWARVITIEHLANSSHAIGLLARKYPRNLPQVLL